MSMYVQLLALACDNFNHADSDDPLEAAVADLVRLRDQSGEYEGSGVASRNTADALADQLRHDIALIEVARYYTMQCHQADFVDPAHARAALFEGLRRQGFELPQSGIRICLALVAEESTARCPKSLFDLAGPDLE
jgi:hypothetical protein